ncbi:MAG TPA: hypothetical protein VEY10_21770 [Flavisolibacter sp.]|nr:hypothetical protein [Flavisolibacter sp.]
MEHLLFAAYLILLAWLVTRTKFFTASGLTTPQLVNIFLLKVMAGILYGWIGVYYGEMAQMVDTWGYHYESVTEYRLLRSDPELFFSNIFQNTYPDGYTKFLASENSWWNDLKGTFFVKILAIFNLASFGNYYVNVIFYSFISLFGPIAIYRVMMDVFPGRKLPVLLATFLVPSVIYWTSGVHKDGIIFVGLGIVIYHIYFGLREGGFSLTRLLIVFFGLLLVLALRNFLIIPVLPALLAWVLAAKLKYKPWIVFSIVYILFITLFFTARFIHPRLNFPEEVVSRQEAFLKLGGGSAVAVNKMEPTFVSFVFNSPQAFTLSTIRPYPSDVRHLLSLAAAAEINFLLLLFIAFLIWRRKGTGWSPFLLFCIFFSFSILMMIGYTVDVLGAIVRYRSVVLTLLVVPMIAQIDWVKINRLFLGNITNK